MTEYIRVATLDQVPPGRGRPVFVAGRVIALFNVGGEIYALDDACPHAGSSLGMGKLDGAIIQCRGHGLRFDVRTGRMYGVDGLCAKTHRVQVITGEIYIGIDPSDDTPPVASPPADSRTTARD